MLSSLRSLARAPAFAAAILPTSSRCGRGTTRSQRINESPISVRERETCVRCCWCCWSHSRLLWLPRRNRPTGPPSAARSIWWWRSARRCQPWRPMPPCSMMLRCLPQPCTCAKRLAGANAARGVSLTANLALLHARSRNAVVDWVGYALRDNIFDIPGRRFVTTNTICRDLPVGGWEDFWAWLTLPTTQFVGTSCHTMRATAHACTHSRHRLQAPRVSTASSVTYGEAPCPKARTPTR